MRTTERALPGIGIMRELTTGDGERVAVVEHLGSARELFLFGEGAEAPRGSVRLDAREARLLGAILADTYVHLPR